MADGSPQIDLSHILSLPPNNKVLRGLLWASHFFKAHEKIIVIVIAAALVWGLGGKVQDLYIAHLKNNSAHDTAVLNAQADKNAAQAKVNEDLARQNAQLATDYKNLANQALSDNKRLEQANADLKNKLKSQQEADAKLPPDGLADRIVTLANIPKASVIPKPDNTFAVTPDGAVGIAQSLENIPALTNELDNVRKEKANDDLLIAKHDEVVSGLNRQIGGLQTSIQGKDAEIADWKKKYGDDTKLLKAQARRSKGKWFIAGYIAGLATKPLAKFLGY